jgi:hypothetical protein
MTRVYDIWAKKAGRKKDVFGRLYDIGSGDQRGCFLVVGKGHYFEMKPTKCRPARKRRKAKK